MSQLNQSSDNALDPSLLINAIKRTNWGDICDYTDSKEIDINFKDKDGYTALMHAIIMSREVYILKLLRKNARLDIIDNMGRTALMHAAEHCNGRVINHLLKLNNRNINDADIDGNTALFYGAKAFHHGAVAVLMEAGADPTILNKIGESAIHTAIRNNSDFIMTFLFYRQLLVTKPGKSTYDFIKMYKPAIDQDKIVEFIDKDLAASLDLEKMLHIKQLISPSTSIGQYIHAELNPTLRVQLLHKLSETLKTLTEEEICKRWLAQQEPARALIFSNASSNSACNQSTTRTVLRARM